MVVKEKLFTSNSHLLNLVLMTIRSSFEDRNACVE